MNGVKELTRDIPVSGGMAGDGAKFENTYVFTNEGLLTKGAVGVSINSDTLHVSTFYSFNWQEIGKELEVTKLTENRVYELDGISAVDVYARYLGQEIADSLPAAGIEFPLIITRNGMKIARAVVVKESDGSLIFAGNLNVGDRVRFGYGQSGLILSESVKTKNIFSKEGVESIFIYSCMARRRFLQESISTELTPFANIAPTTGFFTYGEFFKAENCELLNQTMTVLAMSECTAP
ncbi:MAG: FIST C-terminal domain-containing protein [Sulfurimonas sp.]|nr:FIST C-terminal domain-containing protein [Sulfurimonas sp.]